MQLPSVSVPRPFPKCLVSDSRLSAPSHPLGPLIVAGIQTIWIWTPFHRKRAARSAPRPEHSGQR